MKQRVVLRIMLGLAVPLALTVSSFAAPTPITACGTVITAPGTYELAADLNDCGPYIPGIVINAGHVTLNLNSHSLFALFNFEPGVQINNASDILVLGPGVIEGFRFGIRINNSSVKILGITVTSAGWGGGVAAYNTTLTAIANDIYENSAGISADSSSVVRLINNDVNFNTFAGITFTAGPQQVVRGNRVIGGFGAGIVVNSGTGGIVSDNTVNFNQADGILILADGVTVSGNSAKNNIYGIHLTGTGIVSNNMAESNGLGILAEGTGAKLADNEALHNNTDLKDPTCTNVWRENVFGTSNAACIQ